MKKTVYYIVVVLLFFTIASCGKFLEPNSQGLYIPDNAKDLSEMLIGNAYPTKTSAKTRGLFDANEFYSDDVEMRSVKITYGSSENQNIIDLKYVYSWDPEAESKMVSSGNNFPNGWANYYSRILACNSAIDYIDRVSGTEQDKNRVCAEALTLRAFYYFHLVNLYGEPYNYNKDAYGIPLKLTSDLTEKPLQRSSVKVVYEQILADLKKAEKLFQSMNESRWYVPSARITLPVVHNMLSRVYLQMDNWADAALYAKQVMDVPTRKLYDLNGFVPTKVNPYPCYSVLDNSETYWVFGGSSMLSRLNTYGTISISNPVGGKTIKPRLRSFGASKELINSYQEDDLRKSLYLVREWCDKLSAPYPESYAYYTCASKAYIGETYVPIDMDRKFSMSMRLSEAYLNYAEACFNNKEEGKALQAINDLRMKRIKKEEYKVLTTITLEDIHKERRRELCFELNRWYDLRRWGMQSYTRNWIENGEVVSTFSMEKNDAAYLLQIPQEVFEMNPGMERNRLASIKIK